MSFGATADLAFEQIFPALQALMQRLREKEVEGGGAEDQREEEQTSIDTARRERSMDRLVDRSVRRAVWHAGISLNVIDPFRRFVVYSTLGRRG